MKAPVSHLDDSDMQAAPAAVMRAAERARRLAEQTGTRFVVRTLPRLDGNGAEEGTMSRRTATTGTPRCQRVEAPGSQDLFPGYQASDCDPGGDALRREDRDGPRR